MTADTSKNKGKTKGKAEPKAAVKPAGVAAPQTAEPVQRNRMTMVGTVVSDKMQKTIVVRVERKVKEGSYGKYVTRTERYKAHDEKGEAKVGDLVEVVSSRPLSRGKRWALKGILRRGSAASVLGVE